MYINEYGEKDALVIIMLAPMMVSGSDLYDLLGSRFTGKYRFISPDQGGHGKAGEYISADAEYKELKDYLKQQGIKEIALVYAASLGVAVGYRLFSDADFTVGKAWFDGVALSENAGFAEWFMKKMFRNRKKKLARTHVEASTSLIKMYGYDFAKMMTANFERITENDIDAICHACCHYKLRKFSEDEQKKLHLDFGEKDFDLKYSRKAIPVYMPYAELTIRKGYGHCGYMAAKPDAYVKQIEKFIDRAQ